MFSDSTRGDISPSDLGSGEGSGDDDFTMFDTGLFTGSTGSDVDSNSASPFSGITTEGRSGTTEFGTEMTESSDITDVTYEGSGTTSEEGSGTSPEEGSGATTDTFTEETTVNVTEATTESGSTFSREVNFCRESIFEMHHLFIYVDVRAWQCKTRTLLLYVFPPFIFRH